MSFDPSGETGSDAFFFGIREKALEKRIEEQDAEIKRLRALVKDAFHEGYDSGHGGDFTWEESVSKQGVDTGVP
jgi:hypothetical protein